MPARVCYISLSVYSPTHNCRGGGGDKQGVLSKILTFVLAAGGKVEATVTGPSKNTRNNGLEVPCNYKLKGPTHAMDRATFVIKDIVK